MISRPLSCIRSSSFSAVPAGRFCPISHFWTADVLVLSRRAEMIRRSKVSHASHLPACGIVMP